VEANQSLIAACCVLALPTFVVGLRMLYVRIGQLQQGHVLAVFLAGYGLLLAMWLGFGGSYLTRSGAKDG